MSPAGAKWWRHGRRRTGMTIDMTGFWIGFGSVFLLGYGVLLWFWIRAMYRARLNFYRREFARRKTRDRGGWK